MRPSFHVRPVNGPFDDPGLYVRILREGRALLFDLGFTTSLSPRDILKITDIFVSHAHIDHFIGFDNILRFHLRRDRPLRLYGPAGFIQRIEGRLSGYTWNLIQDYPLVLEIYEVQGQEIRGSLFRAENHFKKEEGLIRPFDGTVMDEPPFKIKAVILDHQIPCLAFSIEEEFHINIDKARLKEKGLPVGSWLRDLKMAIRQGDEDRSFVIDGRRYSLTEVRDIVKVTKGQKLSYVVDALGSEENIKRIVELVRDSDVLYIETYFLDRDSERARERHHLTARQAGMIAGMAGVRRLEPIHISPKYMDDPDEVINEALEAFSRYQG
jgi:ribonuclease Z